MAVFTLPARFSGGSSIPKQAYVSRANRPPRGLLALLLLLFVVVVPAARAQMPAFDYAIGNGVVDEANNRIAVDAQGNTYVTGYFHESTHFGTFTLTTPGPSVINLYVAKFDPAGRCLWAQQAGTTTGSSGSDVAVDAAGHVYLTGYVGGGPADFGSLTVTVPSLGAPFVAKLDGNGRWRWVRLGSGAHVGPAAIALDAQAQGVFITGTFDAASATFGSTVLANSAGPAQAVRNVFVARLDSAGTWQWASSGGPLVAAVDEVAEGRDVAVDNRGHVFVTGLFAHTVAFGTTTLTSAGNIDILVAQLNAATGAWQWARRAGGTDEDAGLSLAADATGHACVTGTFYSTSAQFGSQTISLSAGMSDVFVARLDAQGTFQWVATGGGAEEDFGAAVVMDAHGSTYVAGEFREVPAQFGPFLLPHQPLGLGVVDMFVAKLDSTGNYQWAVGGVSRGNDHVDGLALAGATDDVVLSGWFECDSARFGLNTLAGDSNRWNHYIARLSAGPLLLRTVTPAQGVAGQVVTVSGTHLGNVSAVLFNGVPAPAFRLRSTTSLLATVPVGAASGSIAVRTAAGLSSPGPAFQVQGLASALTAEAAGLQLWPNPVAAGTAIQLQLPETSSLSGPTQAELRNSLGQLVRRQQFGGHEGRLSVQGLAPGLYQLVLLPAGRVAVQCRVVVE
ncbi:IPT/TIG domain-containing protein [Hymenobacter sp. DH14]|uniref:IPT/TIG domain-containing protein n=1 Tax=Hymenobacter cyanobacteriorum TaxID=2926463 RepID=A0A9X2AFE2_9BACT|nr:IPT/TIG domain-containing protein [Hymenobacter cyanobacteriorum]MCI1187777.1 IPT/TIG domain-containing protein [Hymenobacter cyanobacteriorum]